MLLSDTENIVQLIQSPAHCLFEVEELHVKDQGSVGRNGPGNSLGSVAHVWTDGQFGSLALRHLGNPIVPASNDLTKP